MTILRSAAAWLLLAAASTSPQIDPAIAGKVDYYAQKYDIDVGMFSAVIDCESGFDPSIQSQYKDKKGRQEQSYGIAQINLPHNPNVTKAQALDPDYSLDFMARAFSEGNARRWSCYRLLNETKDGL